MKCVLVFGLLVFISTSNMSTESGLVDQTRWFGGPNEIWSSALLPYCYFIPLISIKCHVAFCETQLDFGTGVEQRVLVVSPLSQ